jgi:hypothetical protein
VVFRRNKVGFQYDMGDYKDPNLLQFPQSTVDDSNPANRTDTPVEGVVYDLDGPGIRPNPGQGTFRTRFNFQQYAVLNDVTNTVPASAIFPWYAASSCEKNSSNQSIFATDFAADGDNQSGQGTIKLTYNLQ